MEVSVQALNDVNFHMTPIFLIAGPAETAEADLIED